MIPSKRGSVDSPQSSSQSNKKQKQSKPSPKGKGVNGRQLPTRDPTQVTIKDSFSNSKRQNSGLAVQLDDKMNEVTNRPKTKFGAHTGTKKIIIKNLRTEPRVDLQNYYDGIFLETKEALVAIFENRRPQQSLEKLYRDVEDICRNGQAELLFTGLRKDCENHLKNEALLHISNNVGRKDSIDTLRNVFEGWHAWTKQAMAIRSIYTYLDRSFLLNSKVYPQLNDMAIGLFSNVIFGNDKIKFTAIEGMCQLVQLERTSQSAFDGQLLKESITMLHVLGLYHCFEESFLATSESYFRGFAETNSPQGLKYYISRCVMLLEKEGIRCDAYNFDSSTKQRLLTNAHHVIVQKQSEVLLEQEGLSKLLEARDITSLKDLYGLLSASAIQSQLKAPWEEYIKQAGSVIISDPKKSDDMVVRLLELKRNLDVIIRDAFNKDESFKFAMREAYSNFINDRKNTTAWAGNSLVGEVIAKYIDLLLRGGLKAVPRSLASDATDREDAEKRGQASTGDEDAELDRQLEQGLELFRFIEGKDVFEAFYKKDLARRLLMARSASQDAERNMLTKLKSECGSNFTHNLEQMFKDQEISRDEMISYKQSLSNTSKTTLDLQVSVLSAAAWPTYPDVEVNLPEEVARHISKFDTHYKHKHTGRRLTWKHALAHSIVKAKFGKSTKELIVSGFQAIVLLLFNDIGPSGHLSYEEIQAACGLVDAELERTLQSLACTKLRVLTKHPKGREVNKMDTFTINLGFSDPKFRIKINQIQLKETKEENQETHERVAADRQYETQAAIVRIMKSRKVMTHPNLVSEVINQTKSRGAVELGEIKKNIEKLIEKEYMERDGSSYTYLA